MKTKLPLPKNNIENDNPVKSRERLGWPFYKAKNFYSIIMTESDLRYLDNVIKLDKTYRVIREGDKELRNKYEKLSKDSVQQQQWTYDRFVMDCNIVCFFEKFMNDEKCPKRVKLFLWRYLGGKLTDMKDNGTYKYYVQRSFLTQSWMEICR